MKITKFLLIAIVAVLAVLACLPVEASSNADQTSFAGFEPLTLLGGAGILAALGLCLGFASPESAPGLIDEQLLLQDTVTKTADFDSTALDMGVGFAPGGLGMLVGGVIDVSAASRADGDETYGFKLQQSSDNITFEDISPEITVAVSGTSATTGIYVVRGALTKRYVRVSLNVSNTTPSITYKAWLHPQC